MYWWGGMGGPQVKKFEQVFSDDHQMSLVEGCGFHVWCLGIRAEGRVCTVRSNASWVMVTWDPLPYGQTDVYENINFQQIGCLLKWIDG